MSAMSDLDVVARELVAYGVPAELAARLAATVAFAERNSYVYPGADVATLRSYMPDPAGATITWGDFLDETAFVVDALSGLNVGCLLNDGSIVDMIVEDVYPGADGWSSRTPFVVGRETIDGAETGARVELPIFDVRRFHVY